MAATPSPSARSAAVQDRLIGRLLSGRYRVVSRLGEGGMGTVYLCEHDVLGRRYAVKVLRHDLTDDEELVERFRNEAIAASRIGGANVVDVLDFHQEPDGTLYYVMEALEGRSLGTLIGELGALEVSRALAILEQLCQALAAAHARGVIHRDVKPDNVFLVPRGDGSEQVKVIDFGISRVTLDGKERLTRAGAIIGTPEYMAPEQAKGDPIDHRADIYALGVLAYEMLTGALPLQAETPLATLVAHQTAVPDPPSRRNPRVPADVDNLVLRMLAKRPQDRPPSMAILAAEVAAIRNGGSPPRTTLPRFASPTPRGAPAAPRRVTSETMALPETLGRPPGRRWLVAVGLGAALGVAAGGVWWAMAGKTTLVSVSPGPGPGPGPGAPQMPTTSTSTSTSTIQTATSTATPIVTAAPPSPPAEPGERAGVRGEATPTRAARPRPAKPRSGDTYAPGGLKPDPFAE